MNRVPAIVLSFVAGILLFAPPCPASELVDPEPGIMRAIPRAAAPGGAGHGTANSNCAGAACDTVWIGHSNAGPGGAFLGIHVGGVWDFDTGIAGTDSTQGWTTHAIRYSSGQERPANSRPEWALDYGNRINLGDTNLWTARDLAGRKYVRTGIAGAWHSDTMAGVKLNIADVAEPSATPIAGTRSAWCGLREAGSTVAQDALTGNYINGDRIFDTGFANTLPEFPGFCNQWDQMMYKDFASTGTGTVAFRFRTDMSTFIDTIVNGSGWFNPDPTNIAHFVNNPADSFMVYVGSPSENAYDTNRRWFSEVLDLTRPHREVFAISGKVPVIAADTAVVKSYAGVQPVGGKVRVVFRVKTNRVRGDNVVGTASAYNSKQGAALVDEVQVDGGTIYGFESAATVTGRSLIPDLALDGGPWATTGKAPSNPFRVANVATLVYEDLCGAVGAPTRQCDLTGNVWTPLDAATGRVPIEGWWEIESPAVDLAVRTAPPGTKNAMGIDQETASRTQGVLDFDLYPGHMDFDQSIFFYPAARSYAPTVWKQPISGHPTWSNYYTYPFIQWAQPTICVRLSYSYASIGAPLGSADSLKAAMGIITQGWRFGGDDLGNTRGVYFDNFRIGLIRGPVTAPALSQSPWDKFQDQFPFNEEVPPGDNAAFDTTTALMNTALNIVAPQGAPGVVAGDSIVVRTSPGSGDGVTSGTRVDLIFRIDPGPGNYTVKGNRMSALVNRDPLHPFFATYLANNGPFGSPGGHGGTWNRHVWNSARMDTAEIRYYPILSRAIGGPVTDTWMGALHEQDPNFAALGIDRPLCFLVNPDGSTDESNLSCSGTAPAIYGGVAGSSKEATKILPDGWFSPGTHIEYFVRKSSFEAPGTHVLLFDTTRVVPQSPGWSDNLDQERWSSADVLPDMWKSSRYGGAGLACLLMIDGADRLGADPQYRGAADTLGYGKDDGATSGWRGLGPSSDPNDPAGFVAANLGQYGLNYDHYDIGASESVEGGHPGVRLASNTGGIASKGDRSGPSVAMLGSLYTTVLHFAGDLNYATLHDGFDSQEGANDIALYEGFLDGAAAANRRGLWLSGDGIIEDGTNSDDGTRVLPFLRDNFGAELHATSYVLYAGSPLSTVGLLPVAAWANPGRIYGIDNSCMVHADVLKVAATVGGAASAAYYQALGTGTEFTASVYRPTGSGREFRTLIDGFDLSHLRGNYPSLAAIQTQLGTNAARFLWFDDVVAGHFQICARRGCCTSVGDLPGPQATRFANQYLGAYPNPAFAARTVTLRFTLAAPQPVKVRIYNVAGREVASFEHKGVEGENRAPWDGRLGNGASAPAGVYFYRLDGVRFDGPDDGGAKAKLILLSGGPQ